MPEVTVLIPFFQREEGLLRAAVRSVFEQSVFGAPRDIGPWEPSSGVPPLELPPGDAAVELLIVDDGSPIPAGRELEGLTPPPGLRVRVVRQENGGLVRARNRGLEEADPGTRFFAMIDSDDTWSPWHLERALHALRGGADIYTSNWLTAETGTDAFSVFDKVRLADHDPLPDMEDGFRFVGDLVAQEVRGSIGRPSALVFRWSRFGDLRNDPRLVYASEDQYWRFCMFVRGPELVFSSRPEVSSGVGVSLFTGLDYTSERGLLTLRDRIQCMRLALRLDGFPPEAAADARAAISVARRDIVAATLHRMARRRTPHLRALGTVLRKDPLFGLVWPKHLAGVLRQKFAGPSGERDPRLSRWGG